MNIKVKHFIVHRPDAENERYQTKRKQEINKMMEIKINEKKKTKKSIIDRNTLYLKSIEFSLNDRVNNTIDGFYFS